jgi:hypothetical protein
MTKTIQDIHIQIKVWCLNFIVGLLDMIAYFSKQWPQFEFETFMLS